MAKIWFVADGVQGKGEPIAVRPIEWCRDNGHKDTDWRAPINSNFVINDKTPQSDFANPRHVVITLEEPESGWKVGFYYAPTIRIDQVKKVLQSN